MAWSRTRTVHCRRGRGGGGLRRRPVRAAKGGAAMARRTCRRPRSSAARRRPGRSANRALPARPARRRCAIRPPTGRGSTRRPTRASQPAIRRRSARTSTRRSAAARLVAWLGSEPWPPPLCRRSARPPLTRSCRRLPRGRSIGGNIIAASSGSPARAGPMRPHSWSFRAAIPPRSCWRRRAPGRCREASPRSGCSRKAGPSTSGPNPRGGAIATWSRCQASLMISATRWPAQASFSCGSAWRFGRASRSAMCGGRSPSIAAARPKSRANGTWTRRRLRRFGSARRPRTCSASARPTIRRPRFGGRPRGRVIVRIDVGADGRATACATMATSGSAEIDSTTCRVILRRALFRPAIDAAGRRVAARTVSSVTWLLPSD